MLWFIVGSTTNFEESDRVGYMAYKRGGKEFGLRWWGWCAAKVVGGFIILVRQMINDDRTSQLNGKRVLISTAVATPVMLFIAMFFMGGGHGTYFLGKLFYPIPMMIAGFHNQITPLALWLAILQIPFYGLIIFLTRKSKWKEVGVLLIAIHTALVFIVMNSANSFD